MSRDPTSRRTLGSNASRRCCVEAMDSETARGARPATLGEAAAVGSMAASAMARTSSWTRNGTPPVTEWHALANGSATSTQSSPHQLGDSMLAQWRKRIDLGRRSGGERYKQRRTLP
jgi:hypothetical protein